MQPQENKNKIKLLFEIIESTTGISKAQVSGKERLYKIAMARNTMGVMLHSELGMTIMNAGSVINKDHSTIHHYIRKHEDKMKYDSFYRKMYTKVTDTFWEKMCVADARDIDIKIKSLQKQIVELKRKQELLIK